MGWHRWVGSVAAVGLAAAVAVACGDTTSITIVDVVDGGSEAASDAPLGQSEVDGASDSATADVVDAAEAGEASVDASACAGLALLPMGTSQRCVIVGMSTLSCSGEQRFLYSCPTDSPPLDGCIAAGAAQFDCPAGYVRDTDRDGSSCGGNGRAFEFPSADGTTTVVPRFAGCGIPTHAPDMSVNDLETCC